MIRATEFVTTSAWARPLSVPTAASEACDSSSWFGAESRGPAPRSAATFAISRGLSASINTRPRAVIPARDNDAQLEVSDDERCWRIPAGRCAAQALVEGCIDLRTRKTAWRCSPRCASASATTSTPLSCACCRTIGERGDHAACAAVARRTGARVCAPAGCPAGAAAPGARARRCLRPASARRAAWARSNTCAPGSRKPSRPCAERPAVPQRGARVDGSHCRSPEARAAVLRETAGRRGRSDRRRAHAPDAPGAA